MSLIVKDTKREYSPAPEGLHQAVCVDVVDLGIQKTRFGDQVKIEIRWVIEAIDPKTERPFMVVRRFTPSLHEKASLRATLESWRGRKFNEEELKGFDIEKLLGANCQLQICHNIAEGGDVYANVQAVVPIGKGMPKMAIPSDYVRVCDREKQFSNGNGAKAAPVEDEYVPF